jgi:hypothetical protein
MQVIFTHDNPAFDAVEDKARAAIAKAEARP